jgi:hypothetical protein
MNLVMDQAAIDIESSLTAAEVYLQQEAGLSALLSAFTEDLAKVAFFQMQADFTAYLARISAFLSAIATGTNDALTIAQIAKTGRLAMAGATEPAHLNFAMSATLATWRSAGLTLDPLLSENQRLTHFQNFYAEYLMMATSFMEKGRAIPESLTISYDFHAQQTVLADDYDFMYIISLGTTMIQTEYLLSWKEVVLAELEQSYVVYLYTVTSAGEALMSADYLAAVDAVADTYLLSELNGILTEFQAQEAAWGMDALRSYQMGLLKDLEGRLQELCQTASEASIASMQSAFSSAEGLLKAETEMSFLDGHYATCLEEIESVYEPDLAKMELLEARQKALTVIAFYLEAYFLLDGTGILDQGILNGADEARLGLAEAAALDSMDILLETFTNRFASLLFPGPLVRKAFLPCRPGWKTKKPNT